MKLPALYLSAAALVLSPVPGAWAQGLTGGSLLGSRGAVAPPAPEPIQPGGPATPVPDMGDAREAPASGGITAVPLPPPPSRATEDRTTAPTSLAAPAGPGPFGPTPDRRTTGGVGRQQAGPRPFTEGTVPGQVPPAQVAPVGEAIPFTGNPPAGKSPRRAAPRDAKAPAVSARLPEPDLSPNATPAAFLRAARDALTAGRLGEARSALEMAQTRLLDRDVEAGQERFPSNDTAIRQISEAIAALVADDRLSCLRRIEDASTTIGARLN